MKLLFKISLIALIIFSINAAVPTYTKADLTGNFIPEEHPDFVLASARWSNKTAYLRKEVYASFLKMAKAAKKEGIDLTIVSGTRNHQRQAEIWNEKWNTFSGSEKEKAETILEYSSMPGTSRHHWGTDFDINTVEVSYFETPTGIKMYQWMQNHAWKYGFFQPYDKKGENRLNGYKEEKWHWSYYPISYRLLKAYNHLITVKDIDGFEGANWAEPLNVINNYVNGIYNPNVTQYFKSKESFKD